MNPGNLALPDSTHPQAVALLAIAIPILAGWLTGWIISCFEFARSIHVRTAIGVLIAVAAALALARATPLSSPEIAFDVALFALSVWVAAVPVRGRERVI